jgi:uncharacterized CHY-type Zn-finger protein
MSDKLTVLTLGKNDRVVVPYHPEMPMFQYLKDVLSPALGSMTAHDGATIAENIFYRRPDGICVKFDRATRLEKLGDLIPPDATLHRTLFVSIAPLHGNATREDITAVKCAICRDDATDFELSVCAHRFHAHCLGQDFMRQAFGATLRCPVCRQNVSSEDEWATWTAQAVKASRGAP